MRRLLLFLLTAACGFGLDPGSDAGPEMTPSAEAQTWLDTQNAVRHTARPTPSPPLPDLTWSAAAASVAQAWADGCNYQHNTGRGDRGENIAASAPPGNWSIGDAVAAWGGEISDYDYATNTCASGKKCGHYTQIVWRDTLRVGCAHRRCDTNTPLGSQFPSWDFWVCDYEPPGNWVGRKPY